MFFICKLKKKKNFCYGFWEPVLIKMGVIKKDIIFFEKKKKAQFVIPFL